MQKQTNTKFKRRLAIAGFAAVAAAVALPLAGASAWGPDRTTYTMEHPADKVTFNSIIDNNIVGDERDFVRVAEVGSGGNAGDVVKVTPGKEYIVWIFFHNNAKTSLNETGEGIARGVKVSSTLSSWTVNSKKDVKVTGIISATNADPEQVWDNAYFKTDSEKDVVLKYVDASARIYNNEGKGDLNGAGLSEALFTEEGIYLGYNKFSGIIPGCEEYSGHIVYRVRAEQASSTVSKTVSKDGTNFYKTIDANPGDTLTYKVEFKNTGTVDLTDVTFHDQLPDGVTLVEGTTMLYNNANPNGILMKDVIGKNGFNTGTYGLDGYATVTYQVRLNDNIVDDVACKGRKSFKNRIFVDHSAAEINDSATIYVTRTNCTEDEEPCKPGDPECTDVPVCEDGDPNCTPIGDCDEDDKDCICELNPKDPICTEIPTPPELPKTGPGEIALAIVAMVCIATGGVYWYRSQKDLSKVQKSLSSDHKDDK